MRRSASYSTTPPIPGGIYAPLILGQLQALRTEYSGYPNSRELLDLEYVKGNLTVEQHAALDRVAEGLK